jgi:hypothetical protein
MADITISTAQDLHAFLGTFLDRPEWEGVFRLSTPAEGQRCLVLDLTKTDEDGSQQVLQVQVGGVVKSPFVGAPAKIVPVDGGGSYLQYSQSQWAAVQAALNQ